MCKYAFWAPRPRGHRERIIGNKVIAFICRENLFRTKWQINKISPVGVLPSRTDFWFLYHIGTLLVGEKVVNW